MPKKPNWVEIKKRYLQGDKPATIAKDYGITSKQVRDKAHREEWGALKATLCDKIATKIEKSVERDLTTLSERLMAEYERLAFSDVAKLAKWMGEDVVFNPSTHLTPDETACISSISQSRNNQGSTIKMKLHNKLGAMDSLAEIIGLLRNKSKDDPDHSEKPGINIIMPDGQG